MNPENPTPNTSAPASTAGSTLDFTSLERKVGIRERIDAKNGKIALLMAIAVAVLSVIVLTMLLSGSTLESIFYLIFILVFLGGMTFAVWVNVVNNIRLGEFAKANGMIFYSNSRFDGRPGLIFDSGHSKKFTGIITSKIHDFSEIGNYQYTTGQGKSRRTHNYGYVRIKLPRRLPHMILDSKKNNFFGGRMSNLPTGFSKDQKMSLEGDFDKYFTLYAPAQYKTDALYIFTPDVMQALIGAVHNYDCEVIDDDFYIFSGSKIKLTKKEALSDILAIAEKLKTELHQQSDYYADHRVDNSRALNMVAAPGARLKTRMPTLTIIVTVIIVIYYGLQFLGIFS